MTLVTERFLSLATSVAKARGFPTLPIVVLPSDVETRTSEDLRALAQRTLPGLLQTLTEAKRRPAES